MKAVLSLVIIQTLSTAFAQGTFFTGWDPGATPGGPWPNSARAAAAFNIAAGLLGPVSTIGFEGSSLGQFASLTLGPGVTASQAGHDPALGGIVTNGYTPWQGFGFNTTAGGSRFLAFVPNWDVGTATLDFAFSTPVQAWGAYIVGLESTTAGTVAVQFNDGTANSYPLSDLNPAGVQFFGFTDPNRAIRRVTLFETGISGTRDIYGVDDLSFVAVPEPHPACLFSLAVSILLVTRLRSARCARPHAITRRNDSLHHGVSEG